MALAAPSARVCALEVWPPTHTEHGTPVAEGPTQGGGSGGGADRGCGACRATLWCMRTDGSVVSRPWPTHDDTVVVPPPADWPTAQGVVDPGGLYGTAPPAPLLLLVASRAASSAAAATRSPGAQLHEAPFSVPTAAAGAPPPPPVWVV